MLAVHAASCILHGDDAHDAVLYVWSNLMSHIDCFKSYIGLSREHISLSVRTCRHDSTSLLDNRNAESLFMLKAIYGKVGIVY